MCNVCLVNNRRPLYLVGNDNGGEDRDHDRDRDRDRPNSNRPDLLGTGINYRPTYPGSRHKPQ